MMVAMFDRACVRFPLSVKLSVCDERRPILAFLIGDLPNQLSFTVLGLRSISIEGATKPSTFARSRRGAKALGRSSAIGHVKSLMIHDDY